VATRSGHQRAVWVHLQIHGTVVCGLSLHGRLSLGEDKAGASRPLVMPVDILSPECWPRWKRFSAVCSGWPRRSSIMPIMLRTNPDGASGRPPSFVSLEGHHSDGALFSLLQQGDRVAINHMRRRSFTPFSICWASCARLFDHAARLQSLQAYPSRTKDPDIVDFSTGRLDWGCRARVCRAGSQIYTGAFWACHFPPFIALLGDAELDEGNIWERCWMRRSKGWITCCGLLI